MSLIKLLALSPLTGWFFELGYKFFYRFKFEKELLPIIERQKTEQIINSKLKSKFKDLTVQNGVFKGLKYPNFYSHGSSLYSKLLGTYENELNPVFNVLSNQNFDKIIDVGCAEGYYAVGLARMFPTAKVEGYDIISEAREFCDEMAQINKVDNLVVKTYFGNEQVSNLNPNEKILMLVDCEGYEYELFNSGNISYLNNTLLIIELHDLKNEKISPHLKNLFSATHKMEFIYSINPLEKLKGLDVLENLNEDEKLFGFSERTGIMQWMILTPLHEK